MSEEAKPQKLYRAMAVFDGGRVETYHITKIGEEQRVEIAPEELAKALTVDCVEIPTAIVMGAVYASKNFLSPEPVILLGRLDVVHLKNSTNVPELWTTNEQLACSFAKIVAATIWQRTHG